MTDVSYSRTSLKNMRDIERFYVYQAEPVTEVKLLLFEQRVASGADAAYQGAAPTRPREGNMLYTFTGWDKSLTGITADTEVFAVFKGTVHMEIHNEEELERVRENLDGYYVLAADITLTKPWTPIGATVIGTSSAFTGVFDGDGHTISNVVIAPVNDTNGTNEVSGFFAHIQNAEIKMSAVPVATE